MTELGLLAHDIEKNIDKVSILYYQDREDEAGSIMQNLIVNLTAFVDNLDDEEKINEILEKLREALKAMEDKDYVYLADLLKYEIGEIVSEYI